MLRTLCLSIFNFKNKKNVTGITGSQYLASEFYEKQAKKKKGNYRKRKSSQLNETGLDARSASRQAGLKLKNQDRKTKLSLLK